MKNAKPLFLRPTTAEINLSAFKYNLKKLRKIIGPKCRLTLSIKANAYGHGMAELARFAQKEKLVDGFAVALIEEGIELRRSKITLPILVLGSIYPFSSFDAAFKNNLSVTIASMEAAKKAAAISEKLKKIAKCHIKVDTGLGRIGSRKDKVSEIAKYLSAKPAVKIEGMYTHFASADNNASYTNTQLKNFNSAIDECKKLGIDIGFKHCANSYALIKDKKFHFDMVRPGLAAYGLIKGFKPVLSLKSKVVFLKNIKKGLSVSYGRSFICKKNMRIATIPIGYGDGYPRELSNKGFVLINGKYCKILGSVTMDMIMADVSGVNNVKIGSEAVLIGRQGSKNISADDIALKTKTISYEVVTRLLPRVVRKYEY